MTPVSIAITRNGKLLDHFCAQYVRPQTPPRNSSQADNRGGLEAVPAEAPNAVRDHGHTNGVNGTELGNTNHGRRS